MIWKFIRSLFIMIFYLFIPYWFIISLTWLFFTTWFICYPRRLIFIFDYFQNCFVFFKLFSLLVYFFLLFLQIFFFWYQFTSYWVLCHCTLIFPLFSLSFLLLAFLHVFPLFSPSSSYSLSFLFCYSYSFLSVGGVDWFDWERNGCSESNYW